jgi:hypothetical protein
VFDNAERENQRYFVNKSTSILLTDEFKVFLSCLVVVESATITYISSAYLQDQEDSQTRLRIVHQLLMGHRQYMMHGHFLRRFLNLPSTLFLFLVVLLHPCCQGGLAC